MPIVPVQPFYKSFFQRLFLNPLGLAKKLVKQALPSNKKDGGNINRTDYRPEFYIDICKKIGYKNVQCIPYNPYWKINPDGSSGNEFTLSWYKWYYRTFKKNKTLTLQTSSLFDLCFLLIADKE